MSTNNKKNSPLTNVQNACVIVHDTVIEGDFKSSNDTRLDGKIIGEVVCDAKIITGAKSVIQGNVSTKQASISGTIEGDLKVSEALVLEASSVINGSVNAANMEVNEGATINGPLKIGNFSTSSGEVRS